MVDLNTLIKKSSLLQKEINDWRKIVEQAPENLAMRQFAKQRIRDLEKERQLLNEYIDFCSKERHADRYLKMHPDITALNITSLEPVYIEHQGGWDQIAYISKLS